MTNRYNITVGIALLVAGAMLCSHGYDLVRGNAGSNSGPDTGEIVSHRIAFDERQWNGRKKNVIAVESRILTNAGEEGVRPIFANGEGAWRFALDHPAGSTVQISALGHGDELESDGRKLRADSQRFLPVRLS